MANIEAALKELRCFVESLVIETRDGPTDFTKFGKVVLGKDFSLFLGIEDSSKFANCVQSLYETVEKNGTISRTAVERLVQDAVFQVSRTKVQSPSQFANEG